jgi:hypothetical protein
LADDGRARQFEAAWARAQSRGAATSEWVTGLVTHAFTGADDEVLQGFLEAAFAADVFSHLVQGALRLCSAMARRNRTAIGMMELTQGLMDIEAYAGEPNTKLAVRLILEFAQCDDVARFDTFECVGLDSGSLSDVAATSFNYTVSACEDFGAVFLECLRVWRWLLPEVSPQTIAAISESLWEPTT